MDSLLFFRHPHDVVVSNGGLSCSRRTNKQQWFPMSEESFQEKHLPSSFICRNHQLADLSIRQSVKILVLNFLKSWCFSILAIPKSNSHGTNFHLSENSSWKCFNTVKPAPSLNVQKLAREYLYFWLRKINMDLILSERLFLVLFEWFCNKWQFSTGRGQYKQAMRTRSLVTTSS